MSVAVLQDASLFGEVFLQLQKFKLLSISKLAVIDAGKLPLMLRLAINRDISDQDEILLLAWLEEERLAAVIAQQLIGPLELKEWELDRYSYSEQLKLVSKAASLAQVQQEYSIARRSRTDPLCVNQGIARKGRAGDDNRLQRDAADRDKWARKAMGS
jgi:hypothetical protein